MIYKCISFNSILNTCDQVKRRLFHLRLRVLFNILNKKNIFLELKLKNIQDNFRVRILIGNMFQCESRSA